MKQIAIILLAFNISLAAFAQDVEVKKEVINVNSKPYARIVKSGAAIHNFSVQTLEGEEVLMARYNEDTKDYTIIFAGSGKEARMSGNFNFSKILAKAVVSNKIIKGDSFNADGEKRFLKMHPATGKGVDINNEEESDMPERDRTLPLMITANSIQQDNITIGSYTSRSNTVQGKMVKTISIKDTEGKLIAEATMDGINGKSARIVTLQDNKSSTVFINTIDDMGIVKQIVQVLVSDYYL